MYEPNELTGTFCICGAFLDISYKKMMTLLSVNISYLKPQKKQKKDYSVSCHQSLFFAPWVSSNDIFVKLFGAFDTFP